MPTFLSNFVNFIKINIRERKTTLSLARLDVRKEYSGSALGIAWALIRPLTYVAVYGFAIEVGLRGSRSMDGGVPYLVWLIPGIYCWFFIREVLNSGGSSIRKNSHLVTRSVFPVETIPVFSVLGNFLVHAVLILGIAGVYLPLGYSNDVHALQIPYYLVATLYFGFVVAVLLSALTTISKDVQQLVKSFMRMLFWLSPNLWPISNLEGTIKLVLMLNPIAYLVEGYRSALIYDTQFLDMWWYHLYFWVLMLVLSVVAANVWTRLRPEFADVL